MIETSPSNEDISPPGLWQRIVAEIQFIRSNIWPRGLGFLMEIRFLGYLAWSRGVWVIVWGLICGTTTFFAVAGQLDSNTLHRELRSLTAQLEAEKRWPEQQFVLLRLLDLDPENRDLRYSYALNLEHQGDAARANRILATLAPEDASGYPRAHFARAMQLRDTSRSQSPQEIAILKFHFEQAARDPEVRHTVHEELARLALRTGDFSAAIEHMNNIPNLNAESYALMAVAYRRLNQPRQAEKASETSLRMSLERLRANPKDVESRLLASDQYSALKRDKEAIALLELGLGESPDPRYAPRIAQCCLRLGGMLQHLGDASERPPFEIGRALEYLQRALRHAPQDPLVLEALAKLALVQSPAADEARNMLREILTRGTAPPIVHVVLGTAAMLADKADEANLHLEQAFRLDPTMTVAANNLAYVLSHINPPQNARALELINKAISAESRQPEFRDTRGQILLALDRPQDALVDLELALQAFPNREALHRRLAAAYEKLGDQTQMARHQVRADEIRNSVRVPQHID